MGPSLEPPFIYGIGVALTDRFIAKFVKYRTKMNSGTVLGCHFGWMDRRETVQRWHLPIIARTVRRWW